MNTFDYIVVGAGSAGCVIANRLSEDPAWGVASLRSRYREGSEISVIF